MSEKNILETQVIEVPPTVVADNEFDGGYIDALQEIIKQLDNDEGGGGGDGPEPPVPPIFPDPRLILPTKKRKKGNDDEGGSKKRRPTPKNQTLNLGGDDDEQENGGQQSQEQQQQQADDAADQAQQAADQAQSAAESAQESADSAQAQADASGSEKDRLKADKAQKAAEKAQKAAAKAQKAADKAKKAAEKGDAKGAKEASNDAKNAANEATNASNEMKHSDAIDEMDADEAANDAQESAEKARAAADAAKAAADAIGDVDNSDEESSKNAKTAQKAAEAAEKAAQQTAKAAEDAKNASSLEKAQEAAKKAREAADKAEAAKNTAERADELNDNAEKEREEQWGGGKMSEKNKAADPEELESDLYDCSEYVEKVVKQFQGKLTGPIGEFLSKCRNAIDELNKMDDPKKKKVAVKTYARKAKRAWDVDFKEIIDTYVSQCVQEKKREMKSTYMRPNRRQGQVRTGDIIKRGKLPKKDKMDITMTFYIDISGSMDGDKVVNAFKAAYAYSDFITKKNSDQSVIGEFDYTYYAFNERFHKITDKKIPRATGGNVDFNEILEYIEAHSMNDMINIIITDAWFPIAPKESSECIKRTSGLFIVIANNSRNEEDFMKMKNTLKEKFEYLQADDDFTFHVPTN